MKKPYKPLFSLILIVTVAASSTVAQIPRPTPRQTTARKISVPYVGDNVQAVARAVYTLQADFSKSQFETESEFLLRLESKLKSVKYNDKTLNDIIFSFPPYTKYNPDLKEYTIYIGEIQALPGLLNYKQPERNGLRLVISRESAKNATGARYTEVGGAKIQIPMDAVKAKEAFPSLKINIYGLPIYSLTPQIFNFLVTKVVVFNNSTGEIYGEVSGRNIKYEEYQFER